MAVSSVANSNTFKTSTPSDREIALTRLFDAPRHLVFEAMTKPEHVRRWWGVLDDTHSVTKCEIDLRVGGAWHFVGRHPKGEVDFYGVYREIVPPERLVFTEIYAPYPDVESVVTTVFTEERGKTRLTVTASYPSKDVRDMVLSTGMEKGAAMSYDRLEEVANELARSR
ncbi:MAG: SRPBCC family protein [Vicinamibacterales bacterium]